MEGMVDIALYRDVPSQYEPNEQGRLPLWTPLAAKAVPFSIRLVAKGAVTGQEKCPELPLMRFRVRSCRCGAVPIWMPISAGRESSRTGRDACRTEV